MKERKDLIIEISEGEFWNMFEIKEKFIDCGTFGHVAYGIRKDDQLEVAIKYLK